jgi:hypothetical protein
VTAGLSQEAARQYRQDGYVSPIRVMFAAEAAQYRSKLEAIEASGRLPAGALRTKSHLLLTWVDDIVRHPRVLDAWGLEPADIVTAWIALSESTSENGAMRVVPATHTMEVVPHDDTFAADNLLSRGQEISVEFDEAKAVALEQKPGQMYLHHIKQIHN